MNRYPREDILVSFIHIVLLKYSVIEFIPYNIPHCTHLLLQKQQTQQTFLNYSLVFILEVKYKDRIYLCSYPTEDHFEHFFFTFV
jgi:hypothetical protein